MENQNESAFPFRSASHSETEDNHYGLSKREYFAIQAMQGMLANFADGEVVKHKTIIAEASVALADELLKELES